MATTKCNKASWRPVLLAISCVGPSTEFSSSIRLTFTWYLKIGHEATNSGSNRGQTGEDFKENCNVCSLFSLSLSLSLFLICLGESTISKRRLEVGIDHMFWLASNLYSGKLMLGIYSLLSSRYLLWWPFGGGWNVEGILRLTTYLLIYSVGFIHVFYSLREEGRNIHIPFS